MKTKLVQRMPNTFPPFVTATSLPSIITSGLHVFCHNASRVPSNDHRVGSRLPAPKRFDINSLRLLLRAGKSREWWKRWMCKDVIIKLDILQLYSIEKVRRAQLTVYPVCRAYFLTVTGVRASFHTPFGRASANEGISEACKSIKPARKART